MGGLHSPVHPDSEMQRNLFGLEMELPNIVKHALNREAVPGRK